MNTPFWTPERDAALTLKWNAGLSTARIGADLGTTKNAVIGRARRIGLPARPSPVKASGGGSPSTRLPLLPGTSRGFAKSGALQGATLAALGADLPALEGAKREKGTGALLGPTLAVDAAAPPSLTVFTIRPQPCCWPIGEPRTPGFRFCEAEGVPGKPYCAEHQARAWQPRADRSEAQLAADRARAGLYATRNNLTLRAKWGS